MSVVIVNRQCTKKVNVRRLRQMLTAALKELGVTQAELEINLVAAAEMTRINETFLRHAGSTDVITFDYREPRGRKPEAADNLHGELLVCVDEAVRQARKFKTTWQSEVLRYIVHGILHLLGHEDLKAVSRRRMKRAEDRLVRSLSRRFSLAQLGTAAKLGR